MLSSSPPEYRDDARSHKRPRPDDLPHDQRQFPIPGPSAHPEAESSADGSAKRNRKRPLSCGECRRLKLKCDRVFPCQSCCKRGCAEICPDGALIGGKGSRFILANTEQLHDKIKAMAERIHSLEEGLRLLQSQHSTEPHPLLRQELLSIKRSPELFGVDRNGMPIPSGLDGGRRDEDDHPSIGSSSSPGDIGEDYQPYEYVSSSATSPSLGLPSDIARLSRACPVPKSVHSDLDPQLRQRIRDMLPSRHEGERICEQARLNAFWHYSPDTTESLIPNLIHSVYTTPLEALLPHRLSLFLMILAIGSAVDLQPNRDLNAAERYHHLARAAVCETAVIDDPSFDTINTLFYMVWYLLMFSEHKRAVEHAWGIMGLLAKLALSLGLHRDGVGKMIPEELDKRKALLWNMMDVDVRLSLMLRRPPSICIHHVDVKRPAYNFFDSSATRTGSTYHEWRDSFLSQCQFPVLDSIMLPHTPTYSDALALDTKIRDFDIPAVLRMVDTDGIIPPHPLGMQQALTLCTREIAILNLHRNYFTQALNVHEGFTVRHRYAPSVMATYSSCCNFIWAVMTCYKWEPELSIRLSMFWSNCLSASLALCLLIGRAPSCPLSPLALAEVDKVLVLFAEIRTHCPRAAKALPALEACAAKSRSIYVDWCHGSIDRWGDTNDDEVCDLVRRAGLLRRKGPHTVVLPEEANPFEQAHPSLRRCYEKFMADVPSSFVDPLPGQLEQSISGVSHSYHTSAERTVHVGDAASAHSNSESSQSPNVYNAGMLGTEFLDSSWMTWF